MWLAILLAPPAFAGGVWRQFVAHHAVTAIVMGVAYEAIVAIVGFFAVVAKDVSSRWQKRLADRIDLFIQRKAPRFERHYRNFVLAGLRFVDLKGLATVGSFTPELDEVFVDVSLVSRAPQQVKTGVLLELAGDLVVRRALGDFLGRDKPAVLAVLGGPGSGKTTLLRHTARMAGTRGADRDLPILLYLRDHVSAITADQTVSITDLVRGKLGDLRAMEPGGWFEQKLRGGGCIVLLDGLDEVARREDRSVVAAWAEAQIRQYPDNDFVISSRPQGYQSAPVEGAAVVQVCGFTAAQAQTFLHGWYRAVERHSTGADGADIEARAEDGANDLLRRLEQAPALRDLTVNPLLLTMIANVHKYRGALPGSRADLYSEICQVMLWRRPDAKNLGTGLGGDKKETILRSLAYMMMERRISDLNRDEVLSGIHPGLRRVTTDVTPDEFLADVVSNGLLIERETEQYAFAHHTFQEYLAASHIRDKGVVSVLVGAVNDDWWRETTLLYAARADADPIIMACLEEDTVTALALAFDCDEQGSEFAADLRERLSDLLTSALGPDCSPDRRRLIAGVTLTRHLRDKLRTTTGTRLCAGPITNQIYRFFLADLENHARDAPATTETASGLAVGLGHPGPFIRWANTVSGQQTTYRLPRKAELDDLAERQQLITPPSSNVQYTVWTQPSTPDESGPADVWVPRGGVHPHEVDAATLSAHIAGDLAKELPSHVVFVLTYSLIRIFSLDRIHALALAQDLARAMDVGLDRVHDLDRAPYLARARELADTLNMGPDRMHNLDPTRYLGPARVLAQDLAHIHAPELDLSLAPARDRDLDRTLDLARTRARDLAHDSALALTLALSRDLDQGLTRAFRPPRDVDSRLNRELSRGFALVVGRVLARATVETLRTTQDQRDWAAKFSVAFTEAAGVEANGSFITAPYTLPQMLTNALKMLQDALPESDPGEVAPWAKTVVDRLADNAVPVFDHRERPTTDKTTAIRITALCLAGEADGLDRRDIGDMFRRIAAGVTLLEMRASGEKLATEVIMLAVD